MTKVVDSIVGAVSAAEEHAGHLVGGPVADRVREVLNGVIAHASGAGLGAIPWLKLFQIAVFAAGELANGVAIQQVIIDAIAKFLGA